MRVPQIGRGADGALEMPWLEALLPRAQVLRAHAVLVHGPPGSGQLQALLLLAQAWLCEAEAPAERPCGRCESCRLVRLRTHPDLNIQVPEADQLAWNWVDDEHPLRRASAKPSRQLKIDAMREAMDWSATSSGRGRGKAMVLYPAERLNDASAAALLKTLEEPAPGLRILLGATDPAVLMPTLLSRCQRLPIASPSAAEAKAWLAGHGVADGDALLRLAGGGPQAALELADAGWTAANLKTLPRSVASGQAAPLAGQGVPRAVDLLLRLSHDAMALVVGGLPRYWPADQLVPGADMAALIDWQRELLRVARHAEHPVQAGLLIESLLMQGARAWGATAVRGGETAGPRGRPNQPLNSTA